MALSREKFEAGLRKAACPDCGTKLRLSPNSVRYEIIDSEGESVRLLMLRCLGCPWEAAWRIDENGNPFRATGTAGQLNKGGGLIDPLDEDFELWKHALRTIRQKRVLESLEKKVAALEEKLVKPGPKGFEGLGQKIENMSSFFLDAELTDKQQEVASLRWEYGLPVVEIARRVRKHHSTVQYLLARAESRMNDARSMQKAAKQRAKSGS